MVSITVRHYRHEAVVAVALAPSLHADVCAMQCRFNSLVRSLGALGLEVDMFITTQSWRQLACIPLLRLFCVRSPMAIYFA